MKNHEVKNENYLVKFELLIESLYFYISTIHYLRFEYFIKYNVLS